MEYVLHGRCTLCDKTVDVSAHMTCPTCGEKGILDIEYDYEAMKRVVTRDYFAQNTDNTVWRYRPMMSVKDSDFTRGLALQLTPLVNASRLAETIGLKTLHLKDDTRQPTGSLKDRASAVACMKALEQGATHVACASTGNAASSLAGNAAKLGLRSVIFVPERAPKGKLAQLMVYGADVVRVKGDYKTAFSLSKDAIEHYGWYNRNAAINPHMVEGKKTVALEIVEQTNFSPPDWVVVSVGDGCTIGGVYKGFYDMKSLGLIDRIPKLLGVQAEGCAPFALAHETDKDLVECDENTLADSIAVGIPRNPVKGLRAVKHSRGDFIRVSDEAILDAMKTLGKTEGIFAEPAASAVIAGLEKAVTKNIISADESVVAIITGNGLKDTDSANRATGEAPHLPPDLNTLIAHRKDRDTNA